MKRVIKKIFKGCADATSYEVAECIKKNEDLHIHFAGKVMTLSPKELESKRLYVSKEFGTEGNRPYRLYSYKWEPNEESDD